MVAAFAVLILCHVSVTVFASPVVLHVAALAPFVLGVVEVAVVAPPGALSVAALAGLVLRDEPPILFPVSSVASLHVVAVAVADMAGRACPVFLSIPAFLASFVLGDIQFAVFAVPVILNVPTLASFILGNLKVAVFAKPPH